MSDIPNLTIETAVDPDASLYTFVLRGDVDVTAGEVFDSLEKVPTDSQVILDFALVERINSMGLAQLLRMLETWKNDGVKTDAINLNRMVSMLFKMTGLNRYFGEPAQSDANSGASKAPVKSKQGPAAASTSAPMFRRVRRSGEEEEPKLEAHPEPAVLPIAPIAALEQDLPTEVPDGKMAFSVSLQSNQQLSGWYFLNTLLQRRLSRAISMDIKQLGQTARLDENALVFAKPFDACALMDRHRFVPIARPVDDTDEVSIIVRKEDAHKSITDFAGASVATAFKDSFVFLLGRFLCDECELDSSALKYEFTGNEITALRMLIMGKADMLFMLKKNYHQLSRLAQEQTHLLDETDTMTAYHMLLVSREFAAIRNPLADALLQLNNDEKGAQVLKDLGLSGWCRPENDEIAMLQMLYGRYVT